MKSIFEKTTRDELVGRINLINKENTAQWGKMNVFQMLKHCTLWDDMTLGNIQVKRMLVGRIFGRMALKSVLKSDEALRKNSPSSPAFIIKIKDGNVSHQKDEWITRIKAYEHFNNIDFVHPFFGKMTKDQIGKFVFKHSDHHLRQFGV